MKTVKEFNPPIPVRSCAVRLLSNRRGKVGQFQQELYDTLIPVLIRWRKDVDWNWDQFNGSTKFFVEDVLRFIESNPPKGMRKRR